MDINKRVITCRVIELMNANIEKSIKIGLKNNSVYKEKCRKEERRQ